VRVLLAGASGAVGTPLTRQLIVAGHRVVGITRSQVNAQRLRNAATATVAALEKGRAAQAYNIVDDEPGALGRLPGHARGRTRGCAGRGGCPPGCCARSYLHTIMITSSLAG
jgi:nucleoside-diphosphate-sugar epimerase